MVGDETVVIDQGIEKGTVTGSNFQRAFKSMWFGSQAVADDLKDGLLNKNGASNLENSLSNDEDPAQAVVG